MVVYDDSWDRPHDPDDRQGWQESDWLTFYDSNSRVGGIYRIGRQPNRQKGQPSLFCFALGAQRFLMKDLGGRGLDCDMSADDVWDTGYRVAGHTVEALGHSRMRFTWVYPETEAALEFIESFYTPRGWDRSGKGSDIIAWINPDGHLECAGRLTGTLRIGSAEYSVDCFAHRDRSWGYRESYMEKMNRTCGGWGTTGASFSFATMMLELKSGERLTTGFVSRDGYEEDIAQVRFLATLDGDMQSPVAGIMLLTLESGEVVRVDCDVAQSHGGYAPGVSFNSVGTFVRDGQHGFCDFAMSVSPGAAQHVADASQVTLVTTQAGLSLTADNVLPPRGT